MTPSYCQECGRANEANARACLWCGVPLFISGRAGAPETTRVEIGYLDGIDRFEDPAPVRLSLSLEGIEVAEVIPGTRSVKIPASSILGADSLDASRIIESTREPRKRWLLALGDAAFFHRSKTPTEKTHNYILTIRYKDGNGTHNAVFHREDRAGLSIVESLARIVNSLVRQSAREDQGAKDL